MSVKISNQFGNIEIDKQVISQITYKAAMESYGLVGLAFKSKGIVELLKGENAFKGVSIDVIDENAIEIELYVILQYGTNISTVANNIIDKVKYTVENMTSVQVSKIDINVQGIRVK
ncbi:MAG: Asp23/Gls24 family envelope stress response protein [Peptostreptococcaceae bacterium]